MKKKGLDAYLTIFFTLLLMVFVALSLMLIEGVRSNAMRLELEIAFDTALDSTLAQYHKALFERYDLLAVDSSYGGREAGIYQTEKKLSDYFQANLSYTNPQKQFWKKDFLAMKEGCLEILGVTCLTDAEGRVYRKLCCESARNDFGLMELEQLKNWSQVVTQNHLDQGTISRDREELVSQLEEQWKQKEVVEKNPELESPVKEAKTMFTLGLSNLVLSEGTVSNKGVLKDTLYSSRYQRGESSVGNLPLSEEETALDKLLFVHYMNSHFGSYGDIGTGILEYEREYLVCGKDTDRENLDGVLLRIFGIREGLNAMYLYTDKEKCAQAEAIATAAAVLVLQPELSQVIKQALLLTWISAESACDVKKLVDGKKVPFYKSAETWNTGLTSVLKGLFQGSDEEEGNGLGYQDYVSILLFLTDETKLSYRAMDLTEGNLRLLPNQDSFRLDACYVGISARSTVESGFGYINSIERTYFY